MVKNCDRGLEKAQFTFEKQRNYFAKDCYHNVRFKNRQWSNGKYFSLSSTINSCTKIYPCSLSKRRGK